MTDDPIEDRDIGPDYAKQLDDILEYATKSKYTARRHSRFIVVEQWEGVVLDVLSETFLAHFISTTTSNADELVEILLSEVSADDMNLLQEGAPFYWSIGYLDSETGQRTRQSTLRLRRIPPIEPDRAWIESARQVWLS